MLVSLARGVALVALVAAATPSSLAPANAGPAPPPPANPRTVDLAGLGDDDLQRVDGSIGTGIYGVPVAAGHDVDGDGDPDVAIASMLASPLSRDSAGAVFLVFGDGTAQGSVDTAVVQERVLRIAGAQGGIGLQGEHTGSEIWMDDVDGDGLGDLLICRQDHDAGRGALTILFGDPAVRTFAQTAAGEELEAHQWLDLAAPPVGLQLTTVLGRTAGERFCIWARSGDVDDDGTADVLVGADRRATTGSDNGAAYVLRGGSHLAGAALFELADFGDPGFGLDGQVAEILPPAASTNYHFGATVQLADLDGDGHDEVLIAAALNRAGASLPPIGGSGEGSGGPPFGRLYIGWDDLFPPPPWASGFSIAIDAVPAHRTEIRGDNLVGGISSKFGEELLGGRDFDGDGWADLFVGDITGTAPGRSQSGLGHVFWEARLLQGTSFDLGSLPPGVERTLILGPRAQAISSDTAAQGDFDGDGVDDLAVCSPCDDPLSRTEAGTVHVLYGRSGSRWPASIDLAPTALPASELIEIAEIYGANGATGGGDRGDTLCYSAATGDLDGDARVDLVVNEMRGNAASADDVGNLLVLPGRLVSRPLFSDGFESGDATAWTVGPTSAGGEGAGAATSPRHSTGDRRGRSPSAPGRRPIRPPPDGEPRR